MNIATSPKLLNRLVMVGIVISVCLMVLNVFLSARVSQDGLMIDTLSKRETDLRREIERLEQESVSKTSLTDLSAQAAALGYQKATAVINITSTMPVAAK